MRKHNQSDSHKKAIKKYHQSPKGRAATQIANNKARLKRIKIEGSHTTKEWLELKNFYGNRCLRCSRHELELESPPRSCDSSF
jgi:hypothetical protein